MATVIELCEDGALERIDVPLDANEQTWRRIYGTPEFIRWLEEKLPLLETTVIGGDTEPLEQVDAVFHEYIVGDRMVQDVRFKSLSWTPDYSIWEFKTADIRVFGWVPEKDVFICTFGDMKDDIELYNRYGRYIVQTKYVRDNLDLDEPKFIGSKDYSDVLSDAN